MIFKELSVGDWFTDANAEDYAGNAIFIKVDEENAIALNWNIFCLHPMAENLEVAFCGKFKTTLDDCTKSVGRAARRPFDFSGEKNKYHLIEKFNDIPMGSIYKGKGQTYYKRIDDARCIVFWSPKSETMGKIFSREDWNTHVGTYYICDNGIFSFPEDDIKFPVDATAGTESPVMMPF